MINEIEIIIIKNNLFLNWIKKREIINKINIMTLTDKKGFIKLIKFF